MASQYEGEKDGIISECERCKGLQMVQFECPRHPNPSVSSNFEVGRTPLFHSGTCVFFTPEFYHNLDLEKFQGMLARKSSKI